MSDQSEPGSGATGGPEGDEAPPSAEAVPDPPTPGEATVAPEPQAAGSDPFLEPGPAEQPELAAELAELTAELADEQPEQAAELSPSAETAPRSKASASPGAAPDEPPPATAPEPGPPASTSTEPPMDDLADAAPVEQAEPWPKAPPDPVAEAPAAASGEHVEWRPVVGGEHIEWQPVAVPEAFPESGSGEAESQPAWAQLAGPEEARAPEGEADPAAASEGEQSAEAGSLEPDFEYPPEAEMDTGWDPAEAVEPTSPVAGNGAAGGSAPGGSRSMPGAATRKAASRARATEGDGGPGWAGEPPASRDKLKRQVIILSILTAVVVLVGVLGFVLSRDAAETGQQATPTTQTPGSTVAPTIPESALQTFSDDTTGFTVKVPNTWDRLIAPVADLRLVVNAGGNDGFNVRLIPIEVPATIENIGNFKSVTDAIVFGDSSAKLLQEQLVTLNGLLTYYYLYTFTDKQTNQEGIHAHYFVFEGKRMFSLTFQSVPTDDFRRLAGIFDQVAESFVAKAPATTTLPPTTAPPSTEATTTTVP